MTVPANPVAHKTGNTGAVEHFANNQQSTNEHYHRITKPGQ